MECLLIIDLQRGFINDYTEHIVPRIEQIRNCFLPENCVFTKFVNSYGSLFVNKLSWTKLINRDEQEIVLPNEENPVIIKYSYSAVTNELKTYLKKKRFSNIYLAGVDIDSCVMATAFDLFDLGIMPIFINDCCSSTGGKEMEESAYQIINRSFGEINVVDSNYILKKFAGGKNENSLIDY